MKSRRTKTNKLRGGRRPAQALHSLQAGIAKVPPPPFYTTVRFRIDAHDLPVWSGRRHHAECRGTGRGPEVSCVPGMKPRRRPDGTFTIEPTAWCTHFDTR